MVVTGELLFNPAVNLIIPVHMVVKIDEVGWIVK